MLADGRRVKPVAGLYIDERFKFLAAVFGALFLPDLPDAFDVSLHKVSRIGLAAVGDHLNGGVVTRTRHVLIKINRNHDQAADASGLHHLNQLMTIIAHGGINIGRTG